MAGIEAAEEMTSDQLDAMAGGDLLKNEVILSNIFINMYTQIKNNYFIKKKLL